MMAKLEFGVVNSNSSLFVNYAGKGIQPGQKYYWKVVATTNKGKAIHRNSFLFYGAFDRKKTLKAKWIGTTRLFWDMYRKVEAFARYLRKQYSIISGKEGNSTSRAWFVRAVHINGKK